MSKNLILDKLQGVKDRFEEVARLINDPETISDMKRYVKLNKEYKALEPVIQAFDGYTNLLDNITSTKEMLTTEKDQEMREMAKAEIEEMNQKRVPMEENIQLILIPVDPEEDKNCMVEIRAGTGGDEASIFSGDLFKMYNRYTEKQKWQIEVMSVSLGEHGGFKEIIARISGVDVYSKLKFESGVHRVQRVPETESQGRVHTSACTVAIMPEVKNIEEVNINMSNVRIDTFRASGAGGQHVNKTDSAVRVTHIPTGTVVECQDGRSQHKNKAQALSVLASRILDAQQQEQQKQQASTRKKLIGSGDRSQRIRTYNYPQGRITDHRINLTLYKLAEIMEGDLNSIIEPLIVEQQTNQLTELNDFLVS
jgi:peptide chain release factor 1